MLHSTAHCPHSRCSGVGDSVVTLIYEGRLSHQARTFYGRQLPTCPCSIPSSLISNCDHKFYVIIPCCSLEFLPSIPDICCSSPQSLVAYIKWEQSFLFSYKSVTWAGCYRENSSLLHTASAGAAPLRALRSTSRATHQLG